MLILKKKGWGCNSVNNVHNLKSRLLLVRRFHAQVLQEICFPRVSSQCRLFSPSMCTLACVYHPSKIQGSTCKVQWLGKGQHRQAGERGESPVASGLSPSKVNHTYRGNCTTHTSTYTETHAHTHSDTHILSKIQGKPFVIMYTFILSSQSYLWAMA